MNLVVGATGLLGMEICRRLKARGLPVRGLVRPGSPKQGDLEALGVEIVHGDLKEPATLDAACQGVDCVVSTANSIMFRRKGDKLETVDRDGQLALVAAAKQAGVRHFVYMSVTPNLPDCTFSRYKQLVEAAVRESGMAWTILKPSAFMEIAFSSVAGWDFVKGSGRMAGSGNTPVSYISVLDVAEFTVLSVLEPTMQNRSLVLGGPETITANQAVTVFEEVTGTTFKIQRAPRGLFLFLAAMTRPFNGPLSTIFTLASSNLDDTIDMKGLYEEFPVQPVSVRDFAERVVAGG